MLYQLPIFCTFIQLNTIFQLIRTYNIISLFAKVGEMKFYIYSKGMTCHCNVNHPIDLRNLFKFLNEKHLYNTVSEN